MRLMQIVKNILPAKIRQKPAKIWRKMCYVSLHNAYDRQIASFLAQPQNTQAYKLGITPPPIICTDNKPLSTHTKPKTTSQPPQQLNPQVTHPPLIVSLTSYPARIPYIKYTLYTLLTQTLKPHKLILWLAQDEFAHQSLPQDLLAFTKHGLEIHWCSPNTKAYNKLIPTLKAFPDSLIVTADDDVLYDKHWLTKLYRAYEENPAYIHCHRAHRIVFDAQDSILPYTQWEFEISGESYSPSFLNFLTGVGGVLYPPNSLHQDILSQEGFSSLCPNADDIWFWAMAVLADTKISVLKEPCPIANSFTDQSNALYLTNVLQGQNDMQLKKVLSAYPVLLEKIVYAYTQYKQSLHT